MDVLIIEDDLNYREFISQLTLSTIPEAKIYKASSVDEAVDIINEVNPPLVLSDIELENNQVSFEIFEKVTDFKGKVVFISTHETYALKAIKMSACDYILKPVDSDEFTKVVNKIKSELAQDNKQDNLKALLNNLVANESKKIFVSDRKETQIIDLADVAYFESEGQYTNIVYKELSEGKFVSSMPIRHFEEMLGDDFFRCHRSFIVNLKFVKSFTFTNNIKLKNGEVVPLAKVKKGDFKQSLERNM